MKRLIFVLTLMLVCLLPGVAMATAMEAPDTIVQIGSDAVVPAGKTVDEVVVVNADAHITGKVTGSVVVVNGTIFLEDGATVGGSVTTMAGQVVRSGGATINGSEIDLGDSINLSALSQLRQLSFRPNWFNHFWSGTSLWQLLAVVLLGMLVVWMFPNPVERTAAALAKDPAKSALYGLLAYLALIPLTIVLVITILGIPAIPALWAAVLVARLLGQVSLGLLAGRYLVDQLHNQALSGYVLPIGLFGLGLVTLLPVVGCLASLFYGIVGFGAAIWTRFGTHSAVAV